MLHAKFQIPGSYIDRYFQLFDSLSKLLSQSVSDRLSCEALYLTRGQGIANNNQGLPTTLLEVFSTKIDFMSIICVCGIPYWEY